MSPVPSSVPAASDAAAAPLEVVVSAESLFLPPGRLSRPKHIAIVLRGLPGSGRISTCYSPVCCSYLCCKQRSTCMYYAYASIQPEPGCSVLIHKAAGGQGAVDAFVVHHNTSNALCYPNLCSLVGKSAAARKLRELELAHGGEAPRVLSLDDYFVTVLHSLRRPVSHAAAFASWPLCTKPAYHADHAPELRNPHKYPCDATLCFQIDLDVALFCCRQEVDKEVPDDKRKGKMKTIQELEYRYEPEMEGAPSSAHSYPLVASPA